MKKSLLLSLMATAGMTAFAAQPQVVGLEPIQQHETEAVALETHATNVELNIATSTFKKAGLKAEDSDSAIILPHYYLPAGVFAEGFFAPQFGWSSYYVNSSTKVTGPTVIPPYTNLDWKYSSITGFEPTTTDNMIWQYKYLSATETGYSIQTNQVTKTNSITTPGFPYGYSAWSQPVMGFLNETGTALESQYINGNYQMSYARSLINGTDRPAFYRWNPESWVGQVSYNKTPLSEMEVTDTLLCSAYYNFSCPDLSTGISNAGLFIPKPATMYGMHGIVVGCICGGYTSETLGFSVYKVAKRDVYSTKYNTALYKYELGEKIGGGYIPGDSVPVQNGYYQHIFIPVIEQLGLYESESYLNIDEDIIIMLEGYNVSTSDGGETYTGDLFRPITMCSYNAQLENELVIRVKEDDGSYIYTSGNYYSFGGALGKEGKYSGSTFYTHLCSGINLVYGTLAAYDEEDYYTFNAATAGESKTFEFEPSMDLNDESGMAIIDGEGAYDWYEVTVGDLDENSGLQNVTVKVNALPAGVTGRSSDLLIKIPGAQQVIKITQGEVSGIDSVVSDAAVVSSSYFDLMGRELNAEPETGMFIRQDVKADGSKVATKVVK